MTEEKMKWAESLIALQKKYSIRKAAIKDIALNCEYSESLEDTSNDVKKECTAPIHDDLKQAFTNMNAILCDTCEQGRESIVSCTGFTVGKKDEGATLIGFRELSNGRVLNLVSPFTKFEDNGELEHAIDVVKQEILLYLFEKKHAPDVQMTIDFGENDEEF